MQREKILNLFQNCDFNGELHKENFEELILEHLPDNFIFDYCHGVSKLCILPRNEKYVIKIPFNGSLYRHYSPHEECYYEDFAQANNDRDRNWDYCLTEVLTFREAKKYGVDNLFCETKLVGFVDNHPIYIQEKATPFSAETDIDVEYYSDERTDKTEEYCKKRKFHCFNLIWQSDAIDYYGEGIFNKLMRFINDYDINDLHTDNVGYIGRRPVLFDYSDFME